MNQNPKMRYPNSLVLAIIVVSLISSQCTAAQRESDGPVAETDSRNVETQMVEFAKRGQYDEAIQLGLRSLKHNSADAFIYEQIAIIDIIRARKDVDKRDSFVTEAVSYSNKALAINPTNEDVAGVHLFQIARTFEAAGDLSKPEAACGYYEQATKLLENRAPLLKGNSVVSKGKTTPLSPLRSENQRVLTGLSTKSKTVHCK